MLDAETVLDLTPSTDLLLSNAAQNLNHLTALGELIDNSLDAGATNVRLTFGPVQRGKPTYLIVDDDGTGCPSLKLMVKLGERLGHATTKSGKYGVGGLDAALWYGGVDSTFAIRSIHSARSRSLSICWRKLVESGTWKIELPQVEVDPEPGQRGTQVSIGPLERSLPEGAAWSALVEAIGYTYSPAIKRGAQITIQRPVRGSLPEPVQPWRLPEFEPGVISTNVIVDGREAHVHVGIVKAGVANPRSGIAYWFGDRVIKKNSAAGCGNYSSGRICGVVELRGKAWKLNKNKDGFGAQEESCFEAVHEACQLLLKRADTIGQNLESLAFASDVEKALNRQIFGEPDTKAEREKGDKEGTKDPTGKGGKHRRAKKEQCGTTFRGTNGGPVRSIKIEYVEFPDGDSRVGEFDQGNGGRARIKLSKNHPRVMGWTATRNLEAVVVQVMNLYAFALFEGKVQRQLDVDSARSFEGIAGALLKFSAVLDGQRVDADAKKDATGS